jgi:hydrogenase expression/formation protein HypC
MCLAVPGRVLSTSGEAELRIGRVSFAGIVKEVNLAYVPEAKVDDYVLVHVGFALSVIDEAEAAQTLEYFRQMGEFGELAELRSDAPTASAPEAGAESANSAVTEATKEGGQ